MSISIDDLTFRRQVDHLYSLGPRAIGEFLVALANPDRPFTSEDILFLLVKYQAIDFATLAALGGDDWPEVPFRHLKRPH